MEEKVFDFYEEIRRNLRISVEKEKSKIKLSTKEGRIIIHLLSEPKKRFRDYFRKITGGKSKIKEKRITEEECKKILLDDKLTDIQLSRRHFLSAEENIWEEIKKEVWKEIREDIMKNKSFFYECEEKDTYSKSIKYRVI